MAVYQSDYTPAEFDEAIGNALVFPDLMIQVLSDHVLDPDTYPSSKAVADFLVGNTSINSQLAGFVINTTGDPVVAGDTILQAIQKLAGGLSNAIDAELTGFVSGSGSETILPTDTILEAFQKLSGNVANAVSSQVQVPKSTDYTLVLTDAGKCIYHPTTDANSRLFTIPANSAVAFPVNTQISFINDSASHCAIAITTDTLYSPLFDHTGTQILPANSSATLIKVTSTRWLCFNTGRSILHGKLSNFVSGAGVITGDDTILTALQKLDGNDAELSNPLAKKLDGYVSGAGTITSEDTILEAIQKLNGNTGTGGSVDVLGTTLTGYSSSPGVIDSSDSILEAIEKLDGNIGEIEVAAGGYSAEMTGTQEIGAQGSTNYFLVATWTFNQIAYSGFSAEFEVFGQGLTSYRVLVAGSNGNNSGPVEFDKAACSLTIKSDYGIRNLDQFFFIPKDNTIKLYYLRGPNADHIQERKFIKTCTNYLYEVTCNITRDTTGINSTAFSALSPDFKVYSSEESTPFVSQNDSREIGYKALSSASTSYYPIVDILVPGESGLNWAFGKVHLELFNEAAGFFIVEATAQRGSESDTWAWTSGVDASTKVVGANILTTDTALADLILVETVPEFDGRERFTVKFLPSTVASGALGILTKWYIGSGTTENTSAADLATAFLTGFNGVVGTGNTYPADDGTLWNDFVITRVGATTDTLLFTATTPGRKAFSLMPTSSIPVEFSLAPGSSNRVATLYYHCETEKTMFIKSCDFMSYNYATMRRYSIQESLAHAVVSLPTEINTSCTLSI